MKFLTTILVLACVNTAFGRNKVDEKVYQCPEKVKYTEVHNWENTRGGDGYEYSAGDNKGIKSSKTASFVSANVSGSVGSKFTVECKYKNSDSERIYKMKTSKCKLGMPTCEIEGKYVKCDVTGC